MMMHAPAGCLHSDFRRHDGQLCHRHRLKPVLATETPFSCARIIRYARKTTGKRKNQRKGRGLCPPHPPCLTVGACAPPLDATQHGDTNQLAIMAAASSRRLAKPERQLGLCVIFHPKPRFPNHLCLISIDTQLFGNLFFPQALCNEIIA